MTFDQRGITLVTQRLSIRWFFTNQAETRDATALLINRNEWFDVGNVAQVIDELADLFGGLDVAPE